MSLIVYLEENEVGNVAVDVSGKMSGSGRGTHPI